MTVRWTGVLILHAGVGQENDLDDGLVQALQFYLDDPVQADGVTAAFYATASLRSGLGIWAHETGHLLGLEDRYDPLLQPAAGSEVLNRGGLGRFSLMAAGAWGNGDGTGAALPDGYSAAQLGWYDLRDLPGAQVSDTLRAAASGGEVWRIWTDGQPRHEYFLLETRDPEATAPFDAGLPGRQLLIYHVDESVPAGGWTVDGPDRWHLRVHLVEADGDRSLRDGQDAGGPADLFPGPQQITAFGPGTTPGSDGYDGPSLVALGDITSVADGVVLQSTASVGPDLALTAVFTAADPSSLQMTVRSLGLPIGELTCVVTALGTETWGTFAGGGVSVARSLDSTDAEVWSLTAPISWLPDVGLPAGATTTFSYEFTADGTSITFERTWVWQGDDQVLDFAAEWPGRWVIEHPGGDTGTTWHRWDSAPWLTDDQTPVLACTGSAFTDASAWPAVNYGNHAHALLTSGPLGTDVLAVRLVHALAVETLSPQVAMDGALAVWVDPDGAEVPATPLDGWPGAISTAAENPRLGAPCFTSAGLDLVNDRPGWHTNILPVPDVPGPWRLRLVLAANGLWRREGWFIAAIEPLLSPAEIVPYRLDFAPDGVAAANELSWPWPGSGDGVARAFVVQRKESAAALADPPIWHDVWTGTVAASDGRYRIAWSLLQGLPAGSQMRHEMRVVGFGDPGRIISAPVVVYRDGGAGTVPMSVPWPNPARGEVRFLLSLDGVGAARLTIYDLRGRLVKALTFPVGRHLVVWSGDDNDGRNVAAGVYILRLSWNGEETLRKVVFVR